MADALLHFAIDLLVHLGHHQVLPMATCPAGMVAPLCG
jgi:hypothetical protein